MKTHKQAVVFNASFKGANILRRFFLYVFLVVLFQNTTNAQIGIGVNPPDSSAMLHVQDTARGLLISRMTSAQRRNIHNPAEGLMVYQLDSTVGFWYFSGGKWRSMASSENNGGKQTLVLTGNITDAEARAKILADVGANTQQVKIIACSNLTSVDLSVITNLTNVEIANNNALTSINLGNLEKVEGDFVIEKCPSLTSLNVSSLKSLYVIAPSSFAFRISYTGVLNLTFPSLQTITGGFLIGYNPSLAFINFPQLANQKEWLIPNATNISIIENTALATLSFPLLQTTSGLYLHRNFRLQALTAPLLQKCGELFIGNNTTLTSVSFPSLENITGNFIIGDSALSSFNFPMLSVIGGNTQVNITNAPSFSFPSLTNSGDISITDISNAHNTLTSFSFPLLTTAGKIYVYNINALPAINLPVLIKVGGFSIQSNSTLSSISFPSLTNITGASSISMCSNLVSISFDNLTAFGGGSFDMSQNKLSSTQVNYILNKFVNLSPPISYNYLYLTQVPAAPPTGQGLIDKATLVARPNTVNTN